MPKIPVYRQQVEVAAGGLGPRASSAAFEAPGRAAAGLAQAAGQVAFQFGMAEKQAEADRVYRESLATYGAQADELVNNPKSNTVQGFNIEAGAFRKNALSSIDARDDLTNNQKESIKASLGGVIDRKISAGRGNVFSKQQKKRSEDTNKALNYLIDEGASNPANLKLIMNDIQSITADAQAQGLDVKMDMKDVSLEISKRGFQLKNLGDEQASNAAGLLETRQKIFASDLGRDEKAKLLKENQSALTRVRTVVTDQLIGTVNTVDGSREELNQFASDLRAGKPVTVTVNGKQQVIDPSAYGLSNKNIASVAKEFEARAKEIEDTVSDSVILSMTDGVEGAATVEQGFSIVVSSVQSAKNLGKSGEDIDAMVTESSEQTIDSVANLIDSGDISDVAGMRRALDIAEQSLTQSVDGRDPIYRLSGSTGEKAQTNVSRIAKLRGALNKEVQRQAKIKVGADSILDGSWYQIVDNLKPEEKSSAISLAMQNKTPAQVFNLLENNAIKLDSIAAVFPSALSRAQSPAFDPANPDKVVMDTIELYRVMRLRPGVVSNHVNDTQRAFFDAVLDFEQAFGTAGAVEFVSNAAQISDADLAVKSKSLDKRVKEVIGDTSQGGFLGFFETKATNSSDIEMALKKRAKMFIKYGMEEGKALDYAKKDITKTHMMVGNVLLPRMENMPLDIEKKSQAAVAEFMLANPDSGFEENELAIKPAIPGSPDLWNVVYAGGLPTGKQYTKGELEDLLGAEAKTARDARLAEQNRKQTARVNEIEQSLVSPDDMMLPDDDAGKSLLEILGFGESQQSEEAE